MYPRGALLLFRKFSCVSRRAGQVGDQYKLIVRSTAALAVGRVGKNPPNEGAGAWQSVRCGRVSGSERPFRIL